MDDREFTELDSLKVWCTALGWHWEIVNKYNGKLANGIERTFDFAIREARDAIICKNLLDEHLNELYNRV